MRFLVLINKSCHLKNDCIFVDSIYQKNWLWKRALTCSNSTSTTGNPTLLLLLLSVNCKNPTVNGFSYQVAKGRLLLTSHASFKVHHQKCAAKRDGFYASVWETFASRVLLQSHFLCHVAVKFLSKSALNAAAKKAKSFTSCPSEVSKIYSFFVKRPYKQNILLNKNAKAE